MMAEAMVCQTWSMKARTATGLASFIGGMARPSLWLLSFVPRVSGFRDS